MIVLCPRPLVSKIWPSVKGHIERALAEGHGEMTAADVYSRVERGSWHLWFIPGFGAGCTEFSDYPAYRTLIVRLWSATGGGWLEELSKVEEWAASQGCRAVEIFGRPGWSRVLPYELNQVVLRKEL